MTESLKGRNIYLSTIAPAEAVARASGVEAQPWDRERVVEQLGLSGAALLLDQRVTA
mgnify:CR=1 FL=1